jgi:hypothetical protein
LILLELNNSFRGGNLVLDLFDLFLLKNKLLFNFGSITGQVTEVDEPVVAELSNVFGEFVRGVSPQGGVRADSHFERSHTKGKKLRNVTVGLAAAGSWREYGETVQIQSATEVLSISTGQAV